MKKFPGVIIPQTLAEASTVLGPRHQLPLGSPAFPLFPFYETTTATTTPPNDGRRGKRTICVCATSYRQCADDEDGDDDRQTQSERELVAPQRRRRRWSSTPPISRRQIPLPSKLHRNSSPRASRFHTPTSLKPLVPSSTETSTRYLQPDVFNAVPTASCPTGKSRLR